MHLRPTATALEPRMQVVSGGICGKRVRTCIRKSPTCVRGLRRPGSAASRYAGHDSSGRRLDSSVGHHREGNFELDLIQVSAASCASRSPPRSRGIPFHLRVNILQVSAPVPRLIKLLPNPVVQHSRGSGPKIFADLLEGILRGTFQLSRDSFLQALATAFSDIFDSDG